VIMYRRFGLVLMVNHACNLRCTYCYTGSKFNRPLPEVFGRKAIDRALASQGNGGTLELGFFGGEPLLEPGLLRALLEYARRRAASAGVPLSVSITTNGTVTIPTSLALMTDPDIDLAVSHDGLPEVHDRHRRFPDGRGSSDTVLETILRLVDAGKGFHVVMVVRPDTAEFLPDGLLFLRQIGVRHVEPSLDVWARWADDDLARLERAIARSARVWLDGLPQFSVSWFDEKAGLIAGVSTSVTARCSFGAGEVAVAPSGYLYPCERLIGEDTSANLTRLPGHVLDGDDFLSLEPAPCRCHSACLRCSIAAFCNTTCRCSNYVRTGDVTRPDGLLCTFNKVVFRETVEVLRKLTRPKKRTQKRTQKNTRPVPKLSGALKRVELAELVSG